MQFGSEAERSHEGPGPSPLGVSIGARSARALTNREWALVAPFMPRPHRVGRPRKPELREGVNVGRSRASPGCPWRPRPQDFPPVSTGHLYFSEGRANRLWQTIRFHLAVHAREREGRGAQPSAGVVDSQTVKPTEAGGGSGSDAGKKGKGRTRHAVVENLGLLFGLVVPAADVQDRAGASARRKSIRHPCPRLRPLCADGGEAGPNRRGALDRVGKGTLESGKR